VVALAGAQELLANHHPLAIVTSCPRNLAMARLRAAGLPQPEVLVTPECWLRGKPDPEPYQRGAQALGVPPSDCVVLEDAPSGVESGVRAGMRVVALLTTHRAEQLSGATFYIKSLLELPNVLEALRARVSGVDQSGNNRGQTTNGAA
jgi:sugar-phosphatase